MHCGCDGYKPHTSIIEDWTARHSGCSSPSRVLIIPTPSAEEPRQAATFTLVAVNAAVKSHDSAGALKHTHKESALDKRIEKILTASDAQRGSWGVEVVDLKAAVNRSMSATPTTFFIPASNMKMFTTAAALEKLGPDYKFHTTVETDAAPDGAGQFGDLYLVGRAHPEYWVCARFLTFIMAQANRRTSSFQELADQVKARGVREVAGTLVA